MLPVIFVLVLASDERLPLKGGLEYSNRELKQATSDCRKESGLKTVFVSVCGNL